LFSLLDPWLFQGTDERRFRYRHRRKTVRESDAIHIVSAWADERGLVLRQVQTEEKSNEITAIPVLLEALDISDYILTIDAVDLKSEGCQKTIAQDIVAKHGGYTLTLKENHPEVYTEA
jgi:hypothetical protein